MKTSLKTKALCVLLGAVLGGSLVGGYDYLLRLGVEHHYQELETFFRGRVGERDVLGISYFDYHGIGFLQGNDWKVVLQDENGRRIMIHQNQSSFQESIPHQPKIEIQGDDILIDDGEVKLRVTVN